MKHLILICSIPFLISILAMAQAVSGSEAQGGGLYRIGNGVSAPLVLSKMEPQYTEEARKASVQAIVVTSLVVRQDGSPTDVRVIRGAGFGLDEKAVESIRTWQFKPAMKEGKPVAVFATVEVNFRLLLEDRENQTARLNFTLPQGASRPELKSGEIPANPSTPGDQSLRIRLQVGADGKPRNLTVLESTDEKWEQSVLRKLNSWRFYPSMLQGSAVEAEGVFELTHGRERPPIKK
jgi:TonB family protein